MQQQQKTAIFVGGSRRTLKTFPDTARWLAGNEINELQLGSMPEDWKHIPEIGPGALEIRIHEPHEYRVICVAKFAEAIYILHAFLKKTQKTPKKDIDIARKAYAEIKSIRTQAP